MLFVSYIERLKMTEQNKYTFVSPVAGDWNEYEITIRDRPGDMSSYSFSTEQWDVKVTVEVTRKPKAVVAGHEWIAKVRSFKYNIGDIIKINAVFKDDDETFVVFSVSGESYSVFAETEFREQFIFGGTGD